mgnify:FL=1
MDLEGKSLKGTFIKYIIPSIVAQWVYILYTVVDGIFVARGVGEMALTAVNIITPFTLGMFSLSITMAVGASTIVAIKLGEKDERGAKEVFSQNILLNIIVSVVVTIGVFLNLDGFARFLGATEANMLYVTEYLKGLAPFAFSFILSYSFEMLVKTDGFPQIAVWVVTAGSALNIFLDWLLVIVFPFGVYGAAFATGVSNTVVILLYLIHFFGKKGTIKFCSFKWRWGYVWRIFRNGLSSGITDFSSGIIVFFFNRAIIQYLNEESLIAYTIVTYVQCLALYTMVGISQGYQPLIGYCFGAGEKKKCRALLKYGIAAALVFTVLIVGVCEIFARPIVTMFIANTAENSALIDYSAGVFRIFSLSYLLIGLNVVPSGYFMSVEESSYASIISTSRGIAALLIFLVLFILIWGGPGIWWSPLAAEAATLILTVYFLIRYENRERKNCAL